MTGRSVPEPTDGSPYEWFRRGVDLLQQGHPAAAATVLARAVEHEPTSASVLEAYARAQYDAGRPADALDSFERLVGLTPDADYARFGYGLCLRRLGRLAEAAEQLALAVAMRPDRGDYADQLRQVRATLAARARPGTP